MQQYLQNKKGLVKNVFDQVFDKYDLMNDFMSLGIHRMWKRSLINMMNPSNDQKLVDVGCGTGDIAKIFLRNVNENAEITCVDPNIGMINKYLQGKVLDGFLSEYIVIKRASINKKMDGIYEIKETKQGKSCMVLPSCDLF